ncbi:MAG: hypothetical protein ACLP01_29330 [Solirubrobacteraceae bacterium]
MPQLGTLAFAQDERRVVRIEIRTKKPLEDYYGGWRTVVDEVTGEQKSAHHVRTPAEYLKQRGAIGFRSPKYEDRPWRYLGVWSTGIVDGEGQKLERALDLSQGSEERRLLEILAEQERVEVVWVNEGVRAVHEIHPQTRAAWRAGLEETRGVSREQWREEIEEWKWRDRENWNGEPRPRRHRRRTMAAPEPPVAFFAPRSARFPKPERSWWVV